MRLKADYVCSCVAGKWSNTRPRKPPGRVDARQRFANKVCLFGCAGDLWRKSAHFAPARPLGNVQVNSDVNCCVAASQQFVCEIRAHPFRTVLFVHRTRRRNSQLNRYSPSPPPLERMGFYAQIVFGDCWMQCVRASAAKPRDVIIVLPRRRSVHVKVVRISNSPIIGIDVDSVGADGRSILCARARACEFTETFPFRLKIRFT